jgi:hypothetical protein
MRDKSEPAAHVAPSRQGKTLIGGHFPPEVKRDLKIIAAREDTSIQALLDEAISSLIAKSKGKVL